MRGPDVDIAIPVYNEANALPVCIHRLTEFLDTNLDLPWGIVIVDNGSDDGTSELAWRLSEGDRRVRLLQLSAKGRGGALRAAWSRSSARWVSYMDVDLSTKLECLPALLGGLRDFDGVVASRLHPGSKVSRRFSRVLMSRVFNLLVRMSFRTGLADVQCGFKAFRRDVAQILLPHVSSNRWFFDAELLILAKRNGFRIQEIPVEWTEDLDSRVVLHRTVPELVGELVRLRLRRMPLNLRQETSGTFIPDRRGPRSSTPMAGPARGDGP
jgi:glycosyltransferase involved in cell wall biosynthesis